MEEASCRFQYFFLFVTNLTDPFCKAIQPSGTDPPNPREGGASWSFHTSRRCALALFPGTTRKKRKEKKRIKMTTKMFDQCVVSVYSCTVLPTLRRRSNMCVSPSCASSAPPPSISRICCVFEEGIDIGWGVGFFLVSWGRGRRVLVIIIIIIKYWLLYLIEQKQQWYFLMMNFEGFDSPACGMFLFLWCPLWQSTDLLDSCFMPMIQRKCQTKRITHIFLGNLTTVNSKLLLCNLWFEDVWGHLFFPGGLSTIPTVCSTVVACFMCPFTPLPPCQKTGWVLLAS